MKFEAAIHGCTIPDTPSTTRQRSSSPVSTTPASDGSGFIPFGDPEEYKKMTQEEREALTIKMVNSHKKFVGSNTSLGQED